MPAPLRVRALRAADEAGLDAVLSSRPRSQMFLRAVAARFGPEVFLGAETRDAGGDRGGLVAAACLAGDGGLALSGAPDGLAALARDRRLAPGRWRQVVSGDDDVAAFLAAWPGTLRASREQRFMTLEGDVAPAAHGEAIERAKPADGEALVALHARFLADDLPEAGTPDPVRVAARVRSRLAAGTTWLIRRGEAVVWKADVVVEGPDGAMVAGLVTDPAWRRRGIARAGLVALCARLLASGTPCVALHVSAANAPALRLYESVGFSSEDRFRLAIAGP